MEAGNVNQFLEEITWQEETILFNGKKYFFNPWEHQGIGRLEIQQWNLKDEWVSDFFYVVDYAKCQSAANTGRHKTTAA